jgi:hypothetical protein
MEGPFLSDLIFATLRVGLVSITHAALGSSWDFRILSGSVSPYEIAKVAINQTD